MAEPKLNTVYNCHRTGMIRFEESIGGALMCKIPYQSFDEDAINGTHSCCIGAKDGTMQELTIRNLMEIFKVENLIDLTTLELPDQAAHEFDLSEWEAKEKYPGFRWINVPRKAQSIDSITEKWGGKLALFASKAAAPEPVKPAAKTKPAATKPVEKPAEKPATPERKMPVKAPAAPARVLAPELLMSLLAKKHGVDENDQDAMNKFGNEIYFPATDEVLGNGVNPETPEQCEQVAAKFGV